MKVVLARNPGGREVPMPVELWRVRQFQGYTFIKEYEETDRPGPVMVPTFTTKELEAQGKIHKVIGPVARSKGGA